MRLGVGEGTGDAGPMRLGVGVGAGETGCGGLEFGLGFGQMAAVGVGRATGRSVARNCGRRWIFHPDELDRRAAIALALIR